MMGEGQSGPEGSSSSSSSSLSSVWPASVALVLARFWATVPRSFPRFDNLKEALAHELAVEREGSQPFRGVLFVQQRVMTHVLQHVISQAPELAALKPACLYATGSPVTASLSINPTRARAVLDGFMSGEVNLLVATVMAEEGMDIPAANCVIRLNPVLHSVSLVQVLGGLLEGSILVSS